MVLRLAERASLRATQLDSDDEFPSTVAVAVTHLDSPELAAFDRTVNDSDGADIDACGDTVPASSQVLREAGMQMLADTIHDVDAVGDTALASSQAFREVGVHVLPGSSHQAALVHHSQPRDEEVWVEPIRNASSTQVAVQNRFTPLIDGGLRPSRRLVLTDIQDGVAVDSDTETLVSEPEVDHREPVASSEDETELEAEGIHQRVESREEEVVVPAVRRSRAITRAFATLDEVNLEEVFRDRALVMKKPPAFLKGAYGLQCRRLCQRPGQSHQEHARGNSSCCCREFSSSDRAGEG